MAKRAGRIVQLPVADNQFVHKGPDPEQLAQLPIGNTLPLWAVRPGRSNAQVITGTEDGSNRVYQFVLVALPPQPDDCDQTANLRRSPAAMRRFGGRVSNDPIGGRTRR